MCHSSPILPGMREFEANPSLHPPLMKWCQRFRHLWTSVGHRGFPHSRDVECLIICKDNIFLFALNLNRLELSQSECSFFSPWQQALRSYLPSGDFCIPARFFLFCWPSVKIRHWQTNRPCPPETMSTHRGCLQYCLPGSACGWRPLLDSQAHSSTADCMRHDALWGRWELLNMTWHDRDYPCLQPLHCANISDDMSVYFQVSWWSLELSCK